MGAVSHRVPAWASALIVTWLLATGASAQVDPPSESGSSGTTSAAERARAAIEEGRRLYAELDFVGAIESLTRALGLPGLSPALRADGLETLGAAYVVLDRDEEAERAFTALFELDPYHIVREPSGSPKIARFVARVRAERVPDAALEPDLSMGVELPGAGRVGEPTALRLTLGRPSGVENATLFFRSRTEHEFRSLRGERESETSYRLTLPALPRPDDLELYAEGRDGDGRLLTRAASPLAPLLFEVRLGGEEPAPLWASPWLWVGVGGAALLVVVLVAVAVAAGGGERAPDGTLPPRRVEFP